MTTDDLVQRLQTIAVMVRYATLSGGQRSSVGDAVSEAADRLAAQEEEIARLREVADAAERLRCAESNEEFARDVEDHSAADLWLTEADSRRERLDIALTALSGKEPPR